MFQGFTTTAGTGPLGAAEGTHYLYTDANNGENGDTAILTTAAANLPGIFISSFVQK